MKSNFFDLASICRLLRSSILAVPLLLAVGCATSLIQPGFVTGNTIKNPTIGFHGYELQVPDGFKVYDPKEESGPSSPLVASIKSEFNAYAMQKTIDKENLATSERVQDTFLVYNRDFGVVLKVGTARMRGAISQMRNHIQEKLMANVIGMQARHFGDGEVSGLDIRTVGGRLTGSVTANVRIKTLEGQTLNSHCEVFVVFGSLNEYFVFIGQSLPDQGPKLRPTVDEMIESLKF